MYHVTPVEAAEGARMSKLDQLDAFIEGLRKGRATLEDRLAILEAGIDACKRAIGSVDKGLKMAEQLRKSVGPDLTEALRDFEFPALPDMTELESSGCLSPHEISIQAEKVLLEVGRPMKRGELVKELIARGFQLAGKDKNKNLGTVLWRHPDKFVSLSGLGYWLTSLPLPGVYDPESEAQ